MKKTMIQGVVRGMIAIAGFLAAGASQAAAANESLALKPGSEYLMVANYPNYLHVVDLATESVYKTCALPDAFAPGTTQISPDRRTAYILNNRFGTIYGIALDTCKLTFRAEMSQADNELAKSIFSFTVSADGKELYAVQNPTTLHRDHYRVGEPRFAVYDTRGGLDAKPLRAFPAPRQSGVMQAADDGSVYLLAQNLYKVDVNTGGMTLALPLRDWQRTTHTRIDPTSAWPVQSPSRDFTILYTTAKYQDGKQDPATAEYQYGYLNINLKSGEAEAREFGRLTEIYFTGLRSPKDRNIIYGLLHRLSKYDIAQQKLVQAAELDHTYYVLLTNQAGTKLYLTGTFNDIAIYDADTLTRTGQVKLPGGDMSQSTGQVFIR